MCNHRQVINDGSIYPTHIIELRKLYVDTQIGDENEAHMIRYKQMCDHRQVINDGSIYPTHVIELHKLYVDTQIGDEKGIRRSN
jgi:hypothetical protein